MSFRTFTPLLRRPLFVSLSLTSLVAAPLVLQHHQPLRYRHYCDSSPSPITSKDWTTRNENKLPPPERFMTARSIRQLSTGSILGLLGGVAVGFFSKTLALLFGLGIVCVQYVESKGIHVIPYKKIQQYVTNVDVKGAMQENVALKMSFGMAFALAAFAEF